MKYFFMMSVLLISHAYAGDMFKLDRETAKVLVMNAMTYKREVLLTNKLEGLFVTEDSAYLDLTILPKYQFIKNQLDLDATSVDNEIKNQYAEALAYFGVSFKVSETFIEVNIDKDLNDSMNGAFSHLDMIVDSVALIETYARFLKERGIEPSNAVKVDPVQAERQSLCDAVCWGKNLLCLSYSAGQLSNCIGFCENHPVPPTNCFDNCVLERNFRNLECHIDYLLCLSKCGGSC